jgi:diaminopimelate epimerase
MPGGEILIELSDQYDVQMTGPVTRVGDGVIDPELFSTRLPAATGG